MMITTILSYIIIIIIIINRHKYIVRHSLANNVMYDKNIRIFTYR